MADVYLIALADRKDTYYRITNKEVFDWLSKPPSFPPGLHSFLDPEEPAALAELHEEEEAEGYEGVYITRGSWENDRAMAVRSINPYKTYFSAKAALEAIEAQGDKLVDEYHGLMY